ncbi:YraN family protein [Candidatus Poribacteria bacterium]|nr:YraN family protein [Candidatus Poribacteria bacterium]
MNRVPAAELGRRGEDAACAFLERLGYSILQRNVRTPHGEIDAIARDGDTLVFVEVKARRGTRFGDPSEAVTKTKRARLCRSGMAFLQERGWLDAPCRFDVVAILERAGEWDVIHTIDAFQCDDSMWDSTGR